MHEYEFLGPIVGPVGIIFGLPVVCYVLGIASGQQDLSSVLPFFSEVLSSGKLFSFQALVVVLGWFSGVALLHLVLPGRHALGVVLSDKSRLKYKLNGFSILVTVYALCLGGAFATPYLNLGWLYLNWLQILTASTLLSFALSFYLFATSFREKALLADGGTSPSNLYNFFIGRELNPRIGRFDLKEFCELYPGLIGWVVLNLGMAHQQWLVLGRVTNSMVLVNVFHLVYVADALWHEKSILTTMDITTDGFGFMLAFGDLTWVPFIYAIQAKFLVDQPVDLNPLHATLVALLNILGYAIFRGANSQKDQFRRDPGHPSVSHLKTMKTERGRELIVSGWWGIARHINYTGDWLMSLAWCLTTGFFSVVPYFHAVYFAILLIHRDIRDGLSCRMKYGKDWDKYCAKECLLALIQASFLLPLFWSICLTNVPHSALLSSAPVQQDTTITLHSYIHSYIHTFAGVLISGCLKTTNYESVHALVGLFTVDLQIVRMTLMDMFRRISKGTLSFPQPLARSEDRKSNPLGCPTED